MKKQLKNRMDEQTSAEPGPSARQFTAQDSRRSGQSKIRSDSAPAATGGRAVRAPLPFVMVCLSPSPSNKRVIRAAARAALSSASAPIALYVTRTGHEMEEDTRLRENILFARENGFEIHTVMGSDISEAVAEYARRAGVTDLFLGYSPPSFFLQARRPLNERLLHYLPSVDIHIIPDQISSSFAGAMKKEGVRISWNLQDLLRVFAIMAVTTFLALWFYHSRFSNSNIITIYILGVLIASVMTSSRVYGLLAAVLYVLLFNFLFIEPRFTLLVYDSAYLMTYLVTIVAALITGTVTIRMKNIAAVSAENAYQTKVLLDTSNQLEMAVENEDILRTTCMQLVHLLRRTVLFCPADTLLTGGDGAFDGEHAVHSGNDIVLRVFPAGAKTTQPPLFRPLGEDAVSPPGNPASAKKNMPSMHPDAAPPPENTVSTEKNTAAPQRSPVLTETDTAAPQRSPVLTETDAAAPQRSPVLTETDTAAPHLASDSPAENPFSSENGYPAVFTRDAAAEADAIRWVLENRQQAGAFASLFPDCACRYLCLFTGDYVFGVIGIDMNGKPFTEFENTILLSIVNACTMALENTRMAQEQRKAEIRAENERLRAGLLRSISHDLRTPLTSIYGNASNLRSHENDLPREDRDKIYTDIMEDAGWLIAQFENILSMTKLESTRGEGGTGLTMTVENIEDVIEESLRHITEHPDHEIRFEPPEEALFAKMDSRLIMQVLINLLNNAVKYTPAGSTITVSAVSAKGYVCVEVADNGPGIPDEDKTHIFDLFYTGTKPLADSYRSLGLGLNLCAQILRAHGGDIEAADNTPSGAVFRFRLPETVVSMPEDPEVCL